MRNWGVLLLSLILAVQALKPLGSSSAERKEIDFTRFQNSKPKGVPASFDCAARELGFQYAQSLQPWRSASDFQLVFDGFELLQKCNKKFEDLFHPEKFASKRASNPLQQMKKLRKRSPTEANFYVDFNLGSDSNDGTLNRPFKTIQRAVTVSRAATGLKLIYLRQGTHYLSNTIKLYSVDSGIIFSAYSGEQVTISGGIPLSISSWQPYKVTSSPVVEYTPGNNIYARIGSPGSNSTTVVYLGSFTGIDQCQQACANFNDGGQTCKAFTFYPPGYNPPWGPGCYGEKSDVWGPTPDTTSISGRIIQYNIYSATVKSALSGNSTISEIPGLRVAGKRAIRARYPNANPETDFFPDGWMYGKTQWLPPNPNLGPSETFVISTPIRSDYKNEFQQWNMGIGGPCSIFDPPESYWCSKNSQGGGAAMYSLPSGLIYPDGALKAYANVSGAIMHAWHPYHWAIWMYEIDSQDPVNRTIKWTKGGFQDARGDAGQGGSQYYIENVLEEVDGRNEYFFNSSTQTLYFFYNGTTVPPTQSFVATNLKVLFDVQGTKNDPVDDITFAGITFADTAITYMDPHGVPSGGDWAMQHTGALTFTGVTNLMVVGCRFDRIDGNAIMLKGYLRNTFIQNNTFSWTGESCIVSWGHTDYIDGTDGEQPRGTRVLYNFFNEFGIWMKQASPWFQAKSTQTLLKGNIMFNGPRALINFNDGFGGGNEVTENLMFNPNRESSDQGPFNSWDRLPFLTEVLNGTPSLFPAYNNIHHNYFFCNYGSNMCIDNDDGSSWYNNHDNVEIYGGHKSDFGGHNKNTYNTLQAYAQMYTDGLCTGYNGDLVDGYVDGYWNNTCIQGTTAHYSEIPACSLPNPNPAQLPIQHDNTIYNALGIVNVTCGDKEIPLSAYQSLGQDTNTKVVKGIPSDDQIIQWAKKILGLSW